MRGVCVILLMTVHVIFLSCCVIGERPDMHQERDRTSKLLMQTRTKRQQQQQQPEDLAEQFFDRIFGIPINTLNSVNDLVKSTIPMFRRARDRIQQQYQNWQPNGGSGGGGGGGGSSRPLPVNGGRPRPSLRSEDD